MDEDEYKDFDSSDEENPDAFDQEEEEDYPVCLPLKPLHSVL